jgi:hypothetical protein
VLIVLLAWPTHSASESPVDTDAGRHGRSSSFASQYPDVLSRAFFGVNSP